ncbi:MAG: hypothetical protein BWY54_00721 [Candidatus Dependentiae bacterium ADurb.Bin331]|nr:MAG: hypothetical protein BWY54_00721 [Candidatus Dependentiae bacterium ADurb.Bin331]
MNHLRTFFLCAFALAATPLAAETTVFGKSFYRQRSQGSNEARWMAGQAHHLYLPDTDCLNGSVSFAAEYQQSFRGKQIAEFLFFNGTDTMTFGPARTDILGTPVAAGATTDVFAQNFFLNPNFFGTVRARPLVRNFIFDMNLYLGLDEILCGLYFRVDVPFNWTSWDMRLEEIITTTGTPGFPAFTFGNPVIRPSPLNSIIEAWAGGVTDVNLPDIKQGLNFAKINGKRSKSGVADLTFIVGYSFWRSDCSHFSLQAALIAPTGNRPRGEFFFEPVVGNGHHVELGGGINAHYELWNNGCDQSFGIYFEGNIFHVFNARQHRTFDLKNNGIGSRYLLFKRFSSGVYAGEVLFGPNILTVECKVQNDVHGDAALMFDYKRNCWTFDVGYNLWGISKDKVKITEDIPLNTFGVQGLTLGTGGASANQTQSLTTINGTFAPPTSDGVSPVTITTDSLDPDSAAHPGAFTNKIFTHLGYTWENCDYLPFLGIGGEVEFSGSNGRALDQWGVWVKGGFTFI